MLSKFFPSEISMSEFPPKLRVSFARSKTGLFLTRLYVRSYCKFLLHVRIRAIEKLWSAQVCSNSSQEILESKMTSFEFWLRPVLMRFNLRKGNSKNEPLQRFLLRPFLSRSVSICNEFILKYFLKFVPFVIFIIFTALPLKRRQCAC